MTIKLKRSEWECYTDTPDAVIKTVNKQFTTVLKECNTPVLAQHKMYQFLNDYKEWGFRDSECNQVVTDVVNNHYKTNINRWESLA
jgi:hypothetical protein